MDHENLESTFEQSKVARRETSHDEGAAEKQPLLHSQVGNRAFTQLVQRESMKSQGAGPLAPEIGDEIRSARGGGRTLDDDTRADMESHLGTDLSAVRVHDDSKSDQLNRSVQAEAFTTGTDVFFKSGSYNPGSSDGRRLLAHELTHVVQQSSGMTDGAGRVSHPDDPHEVEARSVGDAVASAPSGGVDRQGEEEEELQASAVDRQPVQRQEDEELQASAIDRQEDEEEELQASAIDRQPVQRQEEEEEDIQA